MIDKVVQYKINQKRPNVWELYAVLESRGFFGITSHRRDQLVTVIFGTMEEAQEHLMKWEANKDNINGGH